MPIRQNLCTLKSSPTCDDRLLSDLTVDDVAGRFVEIEVERDKTFACLSVERVRELRDHLDWWLKTYDKE